MVKYFVWEPSLIGPVARLWNGMQTDGNGKPQAHIFIIELASNDIRSLEELAKFYEDKKNGTATK